MHILGHLGHQLVKVLLLDSFSIVGDGDMNAIVKFVRFYGDVPVLLVGDAMNERVLHDWLQ